MSFGRCLLFLLHDITGILHRAAEVADSRESVLEPEEPLVAMNQHKVVEAIKYVRDALLVFGLVLLGHQDVAYARHDQRCPGTTARVFKQGYQFKGKLFAAKRKELGYQNVGSEAAKATEQLLLAQDLGFFQPKRRITDVDVRKLGITLEGLQLKQLNIAREAEVRAWFAALTNNTLKSLESALTISALRIRCPIPSTCWQ